MKQLTWPHCERCGAECIGLQVMTGSTAPRRCAGCLTQKARATDADPELKLAFNNAIRRLEHDMVNPPRRCRASIGWRSLAMGFVLGASVACVLAYFFGGHF